MRGEFLADRVCWQGDGWIWKRVRKALKHTEWKSALGEEGVDDSKLKLVVGKKDAQLKKQFPGLQVRFKRWNG